MASKRGRLTRGSSSRAAHTPNAFTFPNLKFLFKAHADKYLKLMDYHIMRERAFTYEDLQGFGEVAEVLQKRQVTSNQSQFIVKRCLGLLALLRGGPIDLGRLIYENIKYMVNAAQRACGHFCVINELCRRVCVPAYPEDEIISPKTPLNASAIRRMQNMHQGEDVQNDQEDNQAGNDEGFYQPQMQNQLEQSKCKVIGL
ncbi:hypothetical protein KIW84_050103 [Lathyrus oleraceus]|uniref:Uncharacterized protein n=1 Tax=Pisum sativum TaxID=3888 RepID=A0A9D4WII5_PEA|nr:hypothetical protein KIW84_050103 [Pisum sativum]